jgi:hypothetical protein
MITNPPTTATNAIATSTITMGWTVVVLGCSAMEDFEEERNKIAIEIMISQNIPIMAEYVFNVTDNPRKVVKKRI